MINIANFHAPSSIHSKLTDEHLYLFLSPLILYRFGEITLECFDKKFFAGVGLNVGNEKPTTCLNATLKRVNPLSRELKREDIIAAFFNKFENLYDVFLKQGNLPFNYSTIMDILADFKLLKYKLHGLVSNMDVLECSAC